MFDKSDIDPINAAIARINAMRQGGFDVPLQDYENVINRIDVAVAKLDVEPQFAELNAQIDVLAANGVSEDFVEGLRRDIAAIHVTMKADMHALQIHLANLQSSYAVSRNH